MPKAESMSTREPLGEDPLRLLDDDSGFERPLELCDLLAGGFQL
jgi:hypothetical protein